MSAIDVMRKALEALEKMRCWAEGEQINYTGTHPVAIGREAITALRAEIERMECAPIVPAIPALTIDEVAEGAPEFADVPKYGPAYLAGAHWAYTLAAARIGARIVKADPLQELADDSKQIGLEY